jgi:hypothetical protein
LTWAELILMAAARWDHDTRAIESALASGFSGKGSENPYRLPEPEPPVPPEVIAGENKIAWEFMGRYLTELALR